MADLTPARRAALEAVDRGDIERTVGNGKRPGRWVLSLGAVAAGVTEVPASGLTWAFKNELIGVEFLTRMLGGRSQYPVRLTPAGVRALEGEQG